MAPKRPHKFTRERVERLLKYIGMGTRIDACRAVGISYDTLLNWEKGRFPRNLTDDQKLLKEEFAEALQRAEGEFVVRHLGYIHQAAAQGDWKASAFLLERRRPEEFGRQTTNLNMNVEVDLNQYVDQVAKERGLTDTERDQLFARVSEHLKKNQKGTTR